MGITVGQVYRDAKRPEVTWKIVMIHSETLWYQCQTPIEYFGVEHESSVTNWQSIIDEQKIFLVIDKKTLTERQKQELFFFKKVFSKK